MKNRSTKQQTAISSRRQTPFFSYMLGVGAIIFTSFLPSVAFSQKNAQGSSDRSAINSRIGSTLKNLGKNNRGENANAERPSLLSRNGNSRGTSKSSTPAATQRPIGVQPQTGSSPATVNTQQSCVLQSGRQNGSADVVEVTLEGSGDVLQTNQSGQYERAGIEFVAGFKYEERFVEYSPTGALRSVREYEQAGMKRKFGSSLTRPLLDSSRKNIVSTFDGKKATVYCPTGPMKAEQYALLSEVPFNTTLLDRLLPNREVKLGDSWQVSSDILSALLGVEAIQINTVYLTLTSIVDNFAEIELYQQSVKDAQGNELPSTLECASEGASVALDLNGKFQFDLTAKRITWFGLRISERRSESVATPGLECDATLKINVAPMEKPEKLTDNVVAKLNKGPKPEQLMLYYSGQKGPWKFQNSRRWKMIEDGPKSTALCYVDRGEAVAQCNILSNGKIDLSTQPTLESYQDEIKKGLGDRFAEFKQATANETEDGVSIYYVVADGVYESLPFRWVYYLITDKEGNQATIMFEIRADFLDRYDDSGTAIVESFKLIPKSSSGLQATLEKKATKTSAEDSDKNGGIDATPSPQKSGKVKKEK